MFRRRTLLGAALSASAALGLAACGKDGEGGDSTASDAGGGAVLDDVTVSGEVGSEPTVEFTPPLSVDSADSRIITKGDGDAIAANDTLIVNSLYADGETSEVVQSWWQGAPATALTVNEEQIGKAAADFFTTATVGARFAMTGWQQDQQQGKMVSLVQVGDIVSKALARADGAEKELPGEVPVTVTRGEDGAPAIEGVKEVATPQTTQRHILLEGTGEKITEGDLLVMHYTGWQVSDGTQFDSSWERGAPFSFALGSGQVIPGWDKYLAGMTVGSQALLIIPPAEAYGEQEDPNNPLGGQTLVFVVDALARGPKAA